MFQELFGNTKTATARRACVYTDSVRGENRNGEISNPRSKDERGCSIENGVNMECCNQGVAYELTSTPGL